MTGIRLPPKDRLRFVLLGHGHHLCSLMQRLKDRNFPMPVVLTHPRADHERDRQLLTDPDVYRDVFSVASDLGVEVIESKSVNDAGIVDRLKAKGCTAAFSCSCRSIIKNDFIRAFDGRIFNLHPSRLPRERGGGTFSWRIMNGSQEVSASLHMIDDGIDTGPVLFQKAVKLDFARPIPNDFLSATNRLYAELIEEFLDAAERGQALAGEPQNEDEATYLPRLHTETNGAIDWSWPLERLERFIRAFGPPYPGAFTFIGDRRTAILEADVEMSGANWHPYAAGRIISKLSDGSVRVIAVDGCLRVRKIALKDKEARPSEVLSITDMFSTPPDVLYRARTNVASVASMKPPTVRKSR